MEVFAALERLSAVSALKASFYAYPLVNALHIAAIGALLTGVALLDLRVIGAFPGLPREAFVQLMRRLALGAFVTAAGSGALLFAVRASHYAAMPIFLVKMALIGLAGLNLMLFLRLGGQGTPDHPSPALRLVAALSLATWTAVLICGRFIGFL